ncbi:MAG: FAD-dependent monooxygenase [Geminicoccaceae bacterium]
MKREEFDVAIIGLGPVGATLAHLCGLQGLRTLVVDREAAHYHLPRAVHFDDEVMRIFQWTGCAEAILPHVRVSGDAVRRSERTSPARLAAP